MVALSDNKLKLLRLIYGFQNNQEIYYFLSRKLHGILKADIWGHTPISIDYILKKSSTALRSVADFLAFGKRT